MPDPKQQDPIADWMLEVTTLLERVNARLQAVEKSTDQNTVAVTTAAAAASAAAAALTRIAKTEEDRLTFEKDQRKDRDAWATRVWSSNAFQLLLIGIVVAVLNVLGVSYIADRLLPHAGDSTAPHQVGTSTGEGGK